MKKICFLFLVLSIPSFIWSQNRYDNSVNVPIINTYVPMSPTMMFLKAASEALEKKQREEQFNHYYQLAYEELQKKHINSFIQHALSALNSGYYTNDLYYNIGVAYIILGENRKGKKFLKKARKNGYIEADRTLRAIKAKVTPSLSWFIY